MRTPIALAVACVAVALFTASSARAVTEPARSADELVDSVGVNTHLHYQGTVYDSAFGGVIWPKLVELGVRHLRDGAATYPQAGPATFFYRRCRALAAAGMRFDFVTTFQTANVAATDYSKLDDVYRWCDGAVDAFEGVNEPDIQPLPAGSPDWRAQTIASQQALYQAVKGNATISAVPVIGPSIVWSPRDVGDISGLLDFGNLHPYPGGACPACGDVYGQTIDTLLPEHRLPSAAKPMVMTETGYHNALGAQGVDHRPVSELAAGKYVPRLVLEYFNRGFARTYFYELIDEQPDPDRTHPDADFGLLRNDGSEKPAYRALTSLLGLLRDPGPAFTPGSLTYTLDGGGDALHHTLLEKRDGTFMLALWQERSSYDTGARPNAPDDPAARRDLTNPDVPITLGFDESVGSVRIHRLDDRGQLSTTTAPIEGHALALAVGDTVTVLEIPRPGCPDCSASSNPAPRLRHVRITPRVITRQRRAPARPSGQRRRRRSRFLYTLSEPATVMIAIERRLRGRVVRRAGTRRCVAARHTRARSRRCWRSQPMGVLRARERAGRQSMPFAGRVRRRALPIGRYRARVTAVDSQGARSRVHRVRFRILRH
jgi:hypothetical protein